MIAGFAFFLNFLIMNSLPGRKKALWDKSKYKIKQSN